VLKGEHVGHFMDKDPTASSEKNLMIVFPPFLPVEGRIVAGEAKNPHALPERSLAKDKIP
jgi:hypothetical protein